MSSCNMDYCDLPVETQLATSLHSHRTQQEKEMGHHTVAQGASVLFFACFLSAALARQCFFDALLLARFQVKGVALDLLDDVFLLHLALEATQRILEGLALLEPYFCQLNYTPKLVPFGRG
jgi:hypothetical protein